MSKLILVLLFGSLARVTVFPTRKDQRFKFFKTRLHLLLLLALSTLQRFNGAPELFGELTAARGGQYWRLGLSDDPQPVAAAAGRGPARAVLSRSGDSPQALAVGPPAPENVAR